MHAYDFVYGNFSLPNEQSAFAAEWAPKDIIPLVQWVSNKTNVLTGDKYEENDWRHVVVIKKDEKICGVVKLFTEFSDWRFGLAWYIRELYTSEEEKESYTEMIN